MLLREIFQMKMITEDGYLDKQKNPCSFLVFLSFPGCRKGQKNENSKKSRKRNLPGRPYQPTCIHLVEKLKEARISIIKREKDISVF